MLHTSIEVRGDLCVTAAFALTVSCVRTIPCSYHVQEMAAFSVGISGGVHSTQMCYRIATLAISELSDFSCTTKFCSHHTLMHDLPQSEFPKLSAVLFGEGVMNDAIGILLFHAVTTVSPAGSTSVGPYLHKAYVHV